MTIVAGPTTDRVRPRQTATGLAFALAIGLAWTGAHIYGVFLFRWGGSAFVLAPLLVATQTWLGAGMFIVAHDAMHGSLAPGRPRTNLWIGRVALGLYAAFPFDVLARKHHLHHRHAGRDHDPDFHPTRPRSFWAWYARFFLQYFGWTQLAVILAVYLVYRLVLHAPMLDALVFWAVPSMLSSLQLFTFGTWLPHRHEGDGGFVDAHRARTLEFGWLASLFACFHFGYHLEHHRTPWAPWWDLPRVRRERRFTAG